MRLRYLPSVVEHFTTTLLFLSDLRFDFLNYLDGCLTVRKDVMATMSIVQNAFGTNIDISAIEAKILNGLFMLRTNVFWLWWSWWHSLLSHRNMLFLHIFQAGDGVTI